MQVMMFTAGDAKRAHRLAREVALTTSLSHPHVVSGEAAAASKATGPPAGPSAFTFACRGAG